MRIVSVEEDLAKLELSSEEFAILRTMMKAGLITDPVVRDTPDEVTQFLHDMIISMASSPSNRVRLSLKKSQFLDIRSIINAVVCFDPEDYYQKLLSEFPDEVRLEHFCDDFWALYKKAFNTA